MSVPTLFIDLSNRTGTLILTDDKIHHGCRASPEIGIIKVIIIFCRLAPIKGREVFCDQQKMLLSFSSNRGMYWRELAAQGVILHFTRGPLLSLM